MYDINKSTSYDINKTIQNIDTRIGNLYTELTNQSIDIENLETISSIESTALLNKIHEIKETLDNINTYAGENVARAFSMRSQYSGPEGSTALIEPTYGIATVPYNKTFSLNLNEFSKEEVLLNTRVKVEVEDDLITLFDDISLINIFDNNDQKVWIDKRAGTSNITYRITITLPKKILPTNIINSIEIKPFPLFGSSLNAATITAVDGKIIPIISSPIAQAENMKFNFPNVAANELFFEFIVPKSENGQDIVFGLRSINISNIKPNTEGKKYLILPLELENGKNFDIVVTPTFVSPNNTNDSISFKLSESTSVETGPFLNFNKGLPGRYKELYLIVGIEALSSNLPLLKTVFVEYKTRNE